MDKEVFDTIASRLREQRLSKNLSFEDLAKELTRRYEINISSDSLKFYEITSPTSNRRGKTAGMRVEYLRCLANFYNVSSDYLLGLTDTPTPDTNIRGVKEMTGLSESAVKHLVMLNGSTNTLLDHVGAQFLDFYSSFITDASILGMLAYIPSQILDLEKNGISEDQENVFNSKDEAIRFYKYQMQVYIMQFIDNYFNDKELM